MTKRPPHVTVADVQRFWEQHPLAAAAIDAPPGSPEFFRAFSELREQVEPRAFQERFYSYSNYPGQRVLDVGCGNGYVLSHFARNGAETTGIDLTRRAVDLSRRRFELEGLRGTFVQASAEQLPFEDSYFDLVVSVGVLHHTPRTEVAVQEIYRVLKPGGRFLLMLYHRNSLVYRFVFPLARALKPSVRGKSQEEMANRVDGVDNPLGKVYSRAEMRELLRAFSEVDVRPECLEAAHFGKEWVGRLVPAAIRNHLAQYVGWFLYGQAVKEASGP